MTEESQETENAESVPANDEQQTTEAPVDGQEQQAEEAHADDNAAQHKNKVPAGKRIRQLTRKWRDSERENEELKARLARIEERLGPAPEPQRPNRDDFDSDEDYEDALFDWRDAKKAVKQPKQEEEPQINEGALELVNAFESELEEIGDDAVLAVMEDDWPCTTEMTDYIMASDVRAQLAYHLATNHDLAEKITKMTPILAARELAKVEEEISSNNKPGATDNQNTPPPPLETNRPSSVPITDADKMSTDQWVEQRRRQMEEGMR